MVLAKHNGKIRTNWFTKSLGREIYTILLKTIIVIIQKNHHQYNIQSYNINPLCRVLFKNNK